MPRQGSARPWSRAASPHPPTGRSDSQASAFHALPAIVPRESLVSSHRSGLPHVHAFRVLRVLRRLLTPPGSSAASRRRLSGYPTFPEGLPGSARDLRPMYPPQLPERPLGCIGLCLVLQTRPGRPTSNAICVPRGGVLPPAPFRPHLAMDTLAFGSRLGQPPSVADFHRQVSRACRPYKRRGHTSRCSPAPPRPTNWVTRRTRGP